MLTPKSPLTPFLNEYLDRICAADWGKPSPALRKISTCTTIDGNRWFSTGEIGAARRRIELLLQGRKPGVLTTRRTGR